VNWRRETIYILAAMGIFLVFYHFPSSPTFQRALQQAVLLLQDYARAHVIFCLIPAFFIAGAIEVFVSDQSVMRYLGPTANKTVAYGVASVAGAILAVCSCTILPLFAGIYTMGAGLGPASTFLYSGPAINVLAIILSAKILGIEIGTARAIAAILAGITIGVLMAYFFRKEEKKRLGQMAVQPVEEPVPAYQTILFMATLILILLSATWSPGIGIWQTIFQIKWYLTSLFGLLLGIQLVVFYQVHPGRIGAVIALTALAVLLTHSAELSFSLATAGLAVVLFFSGGRARAWFESSYILAKKIMPILFLGVFFAGLLLGRPGGDEGLISSSYIAGFVGGNSLAANLWASVIGAFMYFATLTEVPILQGLMNAGMGKGPALALLLAGPAVSLPNMLVVRSIMGTKKTAVFVLLVIMFATVAGLIFGAIT